LAKISRDRRSIYENYIDFITNQLKANEGRIASLNQEIALNADDLPLTLKLAALQLERSSVHIVSSQLSFAYLGNKNEVALVEARTSLTNSLMSLEKVYTNYGDAPFSDYEENLNKVASINEFERYNFIKRVGFFCDYLSSCFGKNNRFHWTFLELKTRSAIVLKNSFNLKTLHNQLDPRAENFRERHWYVNFSQSLLMSLSQSYRKKYEVVDNRIDDFRKAIDLLSILRRLAILLNQSPETISKLQKQIEIWTNKLEHDMRRTEGKMD
jgi:hypothetical protein